MTASVLNFEHPAKGPLGFSSSTLNFKKSSSLKCVIKFNTMFQVKEIEEEENTNTNGKKTKIRKRKGGGKMICGRKDYQAVATQLKRSRRMKWTQWLIENYVETQEKVIYSRKSPRKKNSGWKLRSKRWVDNSHEVQWYHTCSTNIKKPFHQSISRWLQAFLVNLYF